MNRTVGIGSWMIAALVLCVFEGSAQARQEGAADAKWNVAIVVHEDVELLDFAGPGEVFQAASRRVMQNGRPWFNVYTVAPAAGPLKSQEFLTIVPEFTIHDAPAPDILVIPGGATGVLTRDPAFMDWVRRSIPKNELTLTVCTGAFVLAELGVLDGRTVTTHWSSLDSLRDSTSGATVLRDARFADSGEIVTTAGVSAGIDGSLHVVARLLGLAVAEETARYMEYDWRFPAEQRNGYTMENPQLDPVGQALHRAAIAGEAGQLAEAIETYRSIIADHPDQAEALYQLGRLLHTAGAIEEAIPLHRRAAGAAEDGSRFKRNALYNLGCAFALKGRSVAAIEALLASAAAGYDGARWARDDADLQSLHDLEAFNDFLAASHVNRARNLMGWNVDGVALEELELAKSAGFAGWESIRDDPAFTRLRDNPKFVALLD